MRQRFWLLGELEEQTPLRMLSSFRFWNLQRHALFAVKLERLELGMELLPFPKQA